MSPADKVWRVLVVDDHPLMRDGLRAVLRRALPLAALDEAGSSAEAKGKIAIHRPHLILLDVHLPDLDADLLRIEQIPSAILQRRVNQQP